MLTLLRIQNLVLIEKAEISFGAGLNILTGETGAGKSAILAAIRLIGGERADMQLLRKEADLAVVEATITSPDFLAEENIEIPLSSSVTVRREIHRSGKNRCFIEEQQVSLAFLKKCVGSALEWVDQSSSATLCSSEQQRNQLDAFADLFSQRAELASSFAQEKSQESELQSLSQTERERDLKRAQEDLSLIEEVNWQKEEEEKLSQEHHLLTHAQELLEKIGATSSFLTENVPLLKRSAATLEYAARFDPRLAKIGESMKSAALELEEAGFSLCSFADQLEADPKRLETLESRLAAIESIKRRFGATFEEVEAQKQKLQAQVDRLCSLDEQIAALQTELASTREKNLALSSALSEKRKKLAPQFAQQILAELKSLNIPQAKFEIQIALKPLSPNGADEIRFLFSANLGLFPVPLEQCASGGELSRLLLAIKTVLAEKEGCPCLIFDEIDSNVGGQTAAILGEKLKKLAQRRQVICVTHFVQVARSATHHFLVSKTEKGAQTFTAISKLSADSCEREYNRMLGV
ncbi:MAG TPA: AAA family ATPase [Chlamydiales bacterium]|nr:AAA family ATPase [Chlamydiales bacterium]